MNPIRQIPLPDYTPEVVPGRVLDFKTGRDIVPPALTGPSMAPKPYDHMIDDAPYDYENESSDTMPPVIDRPVSERTYIGALSSRQVAPGELSLLAEPVEQNRLTGSLRKLGHVAGLNPEYELDAPVAELPHRADNFRPLVVQAYQWQATKASSTTVRKKTLEATRNDAVKSVVFI